MRKLIAIIDKDGFKNVEGMQIERSENKSAAVHQDSMNSPLQSPITGHIYESKSAYMKHVKRHGCEVVGNDLLSNKKRDLPDRVNDKVILDRIEKAESIYSDPTKMRARQNENHERLERYGKLVLKEKAHG